MVLRKKNGFTLAELLIVIAIVAVLVAIGIPIFTNQLEKSREATDLANVRSAYAEVMAAANLEDQDSDYYNSTAGMYTSSVELVQTQKDWQSTVTELGGILKSDSSHWIGVPQQGGKCTVSYTEDSGAIINWGGYTYKVNACWTHDNYNGVGQKIRLGTGTTWANTVTAVEQPLSAQIGSTVTIQKTDDQTLNKYDIGFYAVDPQTDVILYDSGHQYFRNGYSDTITDKTGKDYTGDVKIYIQLIDPNYSRTAVPEDVAEKLMQLVSVE